MKTPRNVPSAPLLRLACLAALGTMMFVVPEAGRAACTYQTLTSGVTVTATSSPSYASINQVPPYWSAVAVRPEPGSDWDIEVYQNTAGEPACVTGYLTGSAFGSDVVDFVIADFNHTANGLYYPKVFHFSGSGDAQVEWDSNGDQLIPDAAPISRAVEPDQIIEVWDVLLQGGVQYAFHFDQAVQHNLRIALFASPGMGGYWAGRSDAVVLGDRCFGYTPPTTDYYGIVVFKEGTGPASYTLGVSSGLCTCPYELASGSPVGVGNPDLRASLHQAAPYWTAVGLRSSPGSDYDLSLFSSATGGTYPECFSGTIGVSAFGAGFVDFLVGDCNHVPEGTYFTRPYWYSGPGTATVEWDDGHDLLLPNFPAVVYDTGPDDVLTVWDVWLEAGRTYLFLIEPLTGPAPEMMLHLFRNPTEGGYWAGPGSAVLLTATSDQYTAPVSDYYGVVAVNQNGQAGSYTVRVLTCDTPQELASGVPVYLPTPMRTFRFDQPTNYWTAIGQRNATEDCDIAVFGNNSGPMETLCLGDHQVGSYGVTVPDVDYVVGDFNHLTPGAWYAWSYQLAISTQVGGARVEWDSGSDALGIDTPPVHRTTGPEDVLECWDVFLEGGRTYWITLDATAGLTARAELFRSTAGSYWQPRWSSVYSGEGHGSYTAPESDWYGLVVANMNGGTGSYSLAVRTTLVDVDDPVPPAVTALEAIVPNPARGSMSFRYALDHRTTARFEVLDVAGRVVWRQDAVVQDAGHWSLDWRGVDTRGRKLGAGIYFVKMSVDGRALAQRKATLLE